MKVKLLIFVIISFLGTFSAHAADKLEFVCNFNKSVTTTWNDNDLNIEKSNGIDGIVTIKDFDKMTNTALVEGNGGAERIPFILNALGIHLIEVTGFGNIIVTTIFINVSNMNENHFNAVMSRHVYITRPVLSQNYGNCFILQ